MSQPQITIIGAGLSGLVLGRCLLHRGISSILFERETAKAAITRHSYGVTLHPWAYRPLLKCLDLDEHSFRRRQAVDATVGGVGRVDGHARSGNDDASFRANRQKFEQLLREGLDVRWDHELDNLEHKQDTNTIRFRNGQTMDSKIVIGADGPHSQIRKSISPTTSFNILPFAVYNGKRRLPLDVFNEKFASSMKGQSVIEHHSGQTLLQIMINDITDDQVSISYTYSRPARQGDPIFHPERSNSSAKDIPEAFFEEIASLEGQLEDPFKEVFDTEKMRSDRLLNWLMRSLLVPRDELINAAEQGIVLMGDAAHATPILGGNGANAAIEDGIQLADLISEKGIDGISKYHDDKYDTWTKYVDSSEAQLAAMHGMAKSNL